MKNPLFDSFLDCFRDCLRCVDLRNHFVLIHLSDVRNHVLIDLRNHLFDCLLFVLLLLVVVVVVVIVVVVVVDVLATLVFCYKE